jgi:lysozyme
MKISDNGLRLIKDFEGLKLTAYLCPANVPTIGYGHTKTVTKLDVKNRKTITENEATILLIQDIAEYEKAVNDLVIVEIKQNEFDALVSFTFNLGVSAFASSTLRKCVNNKQMISASNEFMKWTKARVNGKLTELKGLVRRRKAEQNLFNN